MFSLKDKLIILEKNGYEIYTSNLGVLYIWGKDRKRIETNQIDKEIGKLAEKLFF